MHYLDQTNFVIASFHDKLHGVAIINEESISDISLILKVCILMFRPSILGFHCQDFQYLDRIKSLYPDSSSS